MDKLGAVCDDYEVGRCGLFDNTPDAGAAMCPMRKDAARKSMTNDKLRDAKKDYAGNEKQ